MSRKVVISSVVAFAAVALAQDPFGRAEPDTNVGPLGFAGKVEDASIEVRSVEDGGPAARARIKAGAKVTAVEGRSFEKDPVTAIVLACEAAEGKAKRDPFVVLTVDGKDVKVVFASLGKHSQGCPKKCKKCEKAVRAGVDFLISKQTADGCFPTELGGKTGKVVVTSLGGLALMAAGGADDSVAKAANYVLSKCGEKDSSGIDLGGGMGGGNWNQENWELAYGTLFLAEYAKKTKRADVKEKLFSVAKKLEANQEASGGWAHGPGGPNALGYLELEIVGNWSLMGLGAARKVGYGVDKPKLEKALDWIVETSSGDGGVGYSPREGQKGFGEAGRTSGAIAAFALLGQRNAPFFAKMAAFYRAHQATLASGHVSPYMHMTSGAIAAYLLGAHDWATYVETYRPQLYAARKSDGSFAPIPTHESQALHSNTDGTVGPCWTTASAVLILSLPGERLPLLLDKAGPEKPEKGEKKTATGGEESQVK